MKSAAVTGHLVQRDEYGNEEDCAGEIWFIPNRFWVYNDKGETIAVMAPRATLRNGKFLVGVSVTAHYPISYTVHTPIGVFKDIHIPSVRRYQLSDLIEKAKH